MGVTMETRNKGKRTQRRAHRDDDVELLARPRNIGQPKCPSSIPRFFFGNAKLRPKPLGKKLKLLSTQKVEGTHKSSAPHLFGSLLLKVRAKVRAKGSGTRPRGFYYFLDPKSKAARLGYSTLTLRKRTGHAVRPELRTKEEMSYAVGQVDPVHLRCALPKCGAKFGAMNPVTRKQYTAAHFVIDHPTDKVASWTSSRLQGFHAAQLKAGTAQLLCLFCNAKKSAADSVTYTPLKK